MSIFDNWPIKPNKTEAQIEMDKAMQEYFAHFGENYVFDFGGPRLSTEEAIEEIRRLIAENKKQKLPGYGPAGKYLI